MKGTKMLLGCALLMASFVAGTRRHKRHCG